MVRAVQFYRGGKDETNSLRLYQSVNCTIFNLHQSLFINHESCYRLLSIILGPEAFCSREPTQKRYGCEWRDNDSDGLISSPLKQQSNYKEKEKIVLLQVYHVKPRQLVKKLSNLGYSNVLTFPQSTTLLAYVNSCTWLLYLPNPCKRKITVHDWYPFLFLGSQICTRIQTVEIPSAQALNPLVTNWGKLGKLDIANPILSTCEL